MGRPIPALVSIKRGGSGDEEARVEVVVELREGGGRGRGKGWRRGAEGEGGHAGQNDRDKGNVKGGEGSNEIEG